MACNPEFVQYIIDQCSGAGEIAVKKMMGDYCAYCDGAKDYFHITDVDDREYLTSLIKVTVTALSKPKAMKNPLK